MGATVLHTDPGADADGCLSLEVSVVSVTGIALGGCFEEVGGLSEGVPFGVIADDGAVS